ncbi:hypothetical protein CFU_2579 [Collimonas fungivorans Ter331]|uniref:Uncharacterized protein n=1 Tax=Collimonas fungivorans (strain Ter331) TaxID=1005048 RepID=G0A9E4_COLFT|nr:hypothetical protein CFU_2579 [Collimonas fungivorans Ter331]
MKSSMQHELSGCKFFLMLFCRSKTGIGQPRSEAADAGSCRPARHLRDGPPASLVGHERNRRGTVHRGRDIALPLFGADHVNLDATQLQDILVLRQRSVLDFQGLSLGRCDLQLRISLAVGTRLHGMRLGFSDGDFLLLLRLHRFELVFGAQPQLLLRYFFVDRRHVGRRKGKSPHIDADHLRTVHFQFLAQRGADVSAHLRAARDQVGSAVFCGDRLEHFLGCGLDIGGQIAVVAVFLVDLGDAVGGNRITDSHADFDRLGIRGAALGIFNVCPFGADAEDGQLLPWRQDDQPFVLDADDLPERSYHAAVTGRHRSEWPDPHQNDNGDNCNQNQFHRLLVLKLRHAFPLIVKTDNHG